MTTPMATAAATATELGMPTFPTASVSAAPEGITESRRRAGSNQFTAYDPKKEISPVIKDVEG